MDLTEGVYEDKQLILFCHSDLFFQHLGPFFRFSRNRYSTGEFSIWLSAYHKEIKILGFEFAPFPPVHEILGWCDYDLQWL